MDRVLDFMQRQGIADDAPQTKSEQTTPRLNTFPTFDCI